MEVVVETPAGRGARAIQATLPWVGPTTIAVAWELSAHARHSAFLPPLSAVLRTLGRMTASGALPSHVAVSSFRALAGLAAAAAIGVPAGILMGHFRPRLHALLEPLLRVLSQVNPFALMSVFLLVFGGGELVKVAAIAWVALWPVLFCTVSGAAGVDPALVRAARAAGAPPATVGCRVVLPAIAPSIFAGLRLASGLIFFVLVAAEMLGASRGLGWLVHSSAMNYQVSGIYAGALAVVVLGFGLQLGLRALEDRILPRAAGQGGAAAARILDLRSVRRGAVLAAALALVAVMTGGWLETRRVLARDRAVMSAPGTVRAEPEPGAGSR